MMYLALSEDSGLSEERYWLVDIVEARGIFEETLDIWTTRRRWRIQGAAKSLVVTTGPVGCVQGYLCINTSFAFLDESFRWEAMLVSSDLLMKGTRTPHGNKLPEPHASLFED
jgi:hypothetical protein